MNLDKIESAAKAATPGPWRYISASAGHENYVYAPQERYASLPGNPSPVKVAWLPPSHDGSDKRDAAHIANMDPQTVLKLVAIARAARRVMSPGGYSRNDWAALRDALEGVE